MRIRKKLLCPVLIAERELIIEREYWLMEKRRKMIHLWQVSRNFWTLVLWAIAGMGSRVCVCSPVFSVIKMG